MESRLLCFAGIIGLIIFGSSIVFAQQDWHWQHPAIQGNTLYDVQFVATDVVYVVGDLGTVLKSEDDGETWTDISVETTKDLYTLHFISADTGWVVGSWSTRGGGGSDGLYKTTDGGQTWVAQYADETIYDMYFMDADTGWAVGGFFFVQKTTDGGDSWTTVYKDGSTFGFGENFYSMEVRDSLIWVVGAESKMISSTDYGETWTEHESDFTDNFASIAFINATEGYIVGGKYDYNIGAAGFMLHTTDAGSTWTETSTVYPHPLVHIAFTDDMHGYATGGKVDYYDYEPHTYEYRPDSSNYILTTTDGGQTWNGTYINNGPQIWYGIGWADQSTGVVVGSGGQIGLTNDSGSSWATNAQTGGNFKDVFFVDSQHGWAVAGSDYMGAIFYTSDGGTTWTPQQIDLAEEQTLEGVYFKDVNTGWAVGEDFQTWDPSWVFYATSDGGATWTPVEPEIGEIPFPLTEVRFVDSQEGWAYSGNSILHTTGGGTSWSLDTTGLGASDIYFADSEHWWTVDGDGEITATTDGGNTWNVQREPAQFQEDLKDAYFATVDSGWVAGDRGTVLLTTDGGQTWEDIFTGIYFDLNDIYFVNSQVGWIAGDGGYLLGSNDGGQSWDVIDDVTKNTLNAAFFLDVHTGWVAGNMGTMLRTSTGGGIITGLEDTPGGKINVPARFTLNQNYPNPFNPSTTIAYTLPRAAKVSVTVYDVLGNQVTQLVNQHQHAGEYSVRWNGRNSTGGHVSAGVYFYRITAGEYEQMKKMVLLK